VVVRKYTPGVDDEVGVALLGQGCRLAVLGKQDLECMFVGGGFGMGGLCQP
jgi:hypothetical protein